MMNSIYLVFIPLQILYSSCVYLKEVTKQNVFISQTESQHLLSFHKVVDQYFFFSVNQNTTLFLEDKYISVLTLLYLEIKVCS